jgi:polar amino acid transport system substrate-binding protein
MGVTAAFVLAACQAGPGSSPTAEQTAGSATPTATAGSAQATPTPDAEACAPEQLTLKNPGRLTLSTDIPAFPPWWGGDPAVQYPNEPEGGSGWEGSDPYSMEGYEGAVAYAVADALGFGPDQVDWIPNEVFAEAFDPGGKQFDFHLAQVSIGEARARAVDFSRPYFDSNQAVLALMPNAITGATSIASLKAFRLGAAAESTSLELIANVIQPSQQGGTYPDNTAGLRALQNGAIDGLVVDLGTAFFMRDVELEDATIVGQFVESAQADRLGLVLEKDSPLTPCVDQAIAQLEATGRLDAIYEEWIVSDQAVPYFEQ